MIFNPISAGGGVKLPELTNPAGRAEIQQGYQAIDQNGQIITGTLGSSAYNRKVTFVQAYVSETGEVSFGDYASETEAISKFELCHGVVYNADDTTPQAMLSLTVGLGNIESVEGAGTYINSSLAIDFATRGAAYYSDGKIMWMVDPGCQLTGRKVNLYLYES